MDSFGMYPFLQAFLPCHPYEMSDQIPADARYGDNENQSDIDSLSQKQIYGNMIKILHSEQYANCGQGYGCECFKHLIISLFSDYGLSGISSPLLRKTCPYRGGRGFQISLSNPAGWYINGFGPIPGFHSPAENIWLKPAATAA
jgi:hypothetical protein